jgi:hypothetical protein
MSDAPLLATYFYRYHALGPRAGPADVGTSAGFAGAGSSVASIPSARVAAARRRFEERYTDMPTWFWLNIPLCVVLFSAVAGIPLWNLRKWSDADAGRARPETARRHHPSRARTQPRREVRTAH